MKPMMSTKFILAMLCIWLGWIGAARADKVTYVYTNPQGSPLAEADAQGNIIARYDYRPYGGVVSGEGPDGPGYTGHVQDPETGLVYMQARYYDPATERFLSADPVMPSPGNLFNFSRYDYGNNNPVTNIDPNGRQSEDAAEVIEARQEVTNRLNPVLVPVGQMPASDLPIADNLHVLLEAEAAESASKLQQSTDFTKAADKILEPAVKVDQSDAGTGRAGKQTRLRGLVNDDKLGSADRGWIKQEINSIDRGQRSSIRNPPGSDLAHERGREAAKGYSYEHSNLQDRDLHRLQHKYDDFGRKNKERPVN